MVLERINPNLEYIQDVLKERNLTPRQLSKKIFGESTHRDIVKEITTKPDVRASTVVKLCRALEISMDSLYKDNITSKQDVQTINGIGIINNSPHAKVDLADLRAENKALKMVIEEKDKRIAEQRKYIEQLDSKLDLALKLQNKMSNPH